MSGRRLQELNSRNDGDGSLVAMPDFVPAVAEIRAVSRPVVIEIEIGRPPLQLQA